MGLVGKPKFKVNGSHRVKLAFKTENRLNCVFCLQTSSKTTTTTMTTPAKLYGKDLSVYDDIDVDELLNKLSAEEITVLAKEVDPDVSR